MLLWESRRFRLNQGDSDWNGSFQAERFRFRRQAPANGGGPVSSYRIERRERPAGDWAIAAMAVDSEATLNGQERGKDLEFRVIAINKSGESAPSNTVAAVL